jgi:hypothetical protein
MVSSEPLTETSGLFISRAKPADSWKMTCRELISSGVGQCAVMTTAMPPVARKTREARPVTLLGGSFLSFDCSRSVSRLFSAMTGQAIADSLPDTGIRNVRPVDRWKSTNQSIYSNRIPPNPATRCNSKMMRCTISDIGGGDLVFGFNLLI